MTPARIFTWLFIASEATFFAFLIVGYLYFHAFQGAADGPTAKSSLDPLRTGLFSVFLLASSATFFMAERSLAKGSLRAVSGWLVATLVLGGVFLFGQAGEYTTLIGSDVTVSRNVFGSSFFTLTGLHALHVFLGLLCIGALLLLSTRRVFAPGESAAVSNVGLYWHFVDAVWVVLFCIVYLGVYV